MTAISYHSGRRGFLGFLTYLTGSDNVSRGGVIPAFTQVDSTGAEAGAGTAGTPMIIGGLTVRPTATFTRPADTTAYASGDLVANSVTAGSVVPMSFAIGRAAATGGMIRRAGILMTGTVLTNAQFRLHLYSASPVPSNGDNGAWLTTLAANYLGAFDITCDKAFTDGAVGIGTPNSGSEIDFTTQTVYGLLEARAAYTPISAEVFTPWLEVLQN